jgi:predicted kinase
VPVLHLTRGIPASGKSTWAREWVAEDPEHRVRVNRDDTRLFLGLKHGQNEPWVTQIQQAVVSSALRMDKDVVVDDTNLNAKFAKVWLKIADELEAEVEWHDEFLLTPLATCLQRDADREASVGSAVIMDFYQRYLSGGRLPKRPQLDSEALPAHARYDGTPGKPKAFLVDLDGTIALNGSDRDHPNRGYFDWHRVGEDMSNERIIEIVRYFEAAGLEAIFVSGRDGVCFDDTYDWIVDHVYGPMARFRDFALFMRAESDMRKDSIVKLEIFDRHIRDNYDIQFALDDRNQVVEAYRSIGLTVLQVADGKF